LGENNSVNNKVRQEKVLYSSFLSRDNCQLQQIHLQQQMWRLSDRMSESLGRPAYRPPAQGDYDPTDRNNIPLDPETIQRKLRQMSEKGRGVLLYWRVAGSKGDYQATAYTVDLPPVQPPRPGQEEDDNYAWLEPEDRPDDADAFPEDGKYDPVSYEYSLIEVEGGSVARGEPTKRRTKPSTTSIERQSRDRESHDGSRGRSAHRDPLENLKTPDLSAGLTGDPMDADRPANAEDVTQWPKFLCHPDRVVAQTNFTTMVSYYRRQFGSERPGGVCGNSREEKISTEDTLSRVFQAMRMLMKQRSIGDNSEWVRNTMKELSALDLKRDAANGCTKRFIDAKAQQYGFHAERPPHQTEAIAKATAAVKAEAVMYDPSVTSQAQREGENRRRRANDKDRDGGGRRDRDRVPKPTPKESAKGKAKREAREKAREELKDKKLGELTSDDLKRMGYGSGF